MTWLTLSLASAFFAGLTAVLSKIGVRNLNSTLATAIRTLVVLAFSWLMVWVTGTQTGLSAIDGRALLFLVLSGLATGASWLCYFRALQLGDVSRVAPVDKSSTVLTILLAFFLLGEPVTPTGLAGMLGIGTGALLMAGRPGKAARPSSKSWFFYALLSALFASLTSILGKLGVQGIDSTLATAIRTAVVLVMAWLLVFAQGTHREIRRIEPGGWLFLILSGIATGLSWLCFYRALRDGPASVVVPVDKLSILLTVAFSRLFLGERLTPAGALGLALMTAGTLLMLV